MEGCTTRPEKSLSELPAEILFTICSSLDFRSLSRLGQTNKLFRDVCSQDMLWKEQCETEYLRKKMDHGVETWHEQYMKYHKKFGRYHCPSVYRTMRRLWDRLENNLRENDPDIYKSLRNPCKISEILICEEKMRHRFPADLRCSLQIHNGQTIVTGVGVLGHMAIASYNRSEALMDAASMARNFEDHWGDVPGCVPITYSANMERCQFIGIHDEAGYTVGEVFYPIVNHNGVTEHDVDSFISARCFKDWLEDLLFKLENKKFPRIENRIYRFETDPESVSRCHDCFTVKAATCFLPEVSTIKPGHFLHVYRITISMDKNADSSMSCQLETRHWIITDMDGVEERVDGEGVVGEYPVMKPGASHSWISCTTFPTTYGYMRGSFTMKNLQSGDEIELICPTFRMKCLPYKLAYDRAQAVLNRKKKL